MSPSCHVLLLTLDDRPNSDVLNSLFKLELRNGFAARDRLEGDRDSYFHLVALLNVNGVGDPLRLSFSDQLMAIIRKNIVRSRI